LLALAMVVASATETFEELAARAAEARQANDISHAIALYKQALELNAKWEEGWWFLGTMQYDTDQYADGQNALEHVVELNPKAGPAWELLGLCEFETGAYGRALEHIQRGLAAGTPAEPQMDRVLRYHEALLLTRSGKFDKALEKYALFVRAGQANPAILLGAGLAALRKPLLPKEVPPKQQDLFATAGKAVALTIAGDIAGARQTYQTLLARYPAASNVHYLHGVFLSATDADGAIAEFKRELEITPVNAAAQLILGRLLVERGTVDDGVTHLQMAENLDSGNLEVHLALVTAYSRMGQTQNARRERQVSLEMTREMGPVAQP
jgi:tetratricopeptide (TPR) repeat protein